MLPSRNSNLPQFNALAINYSTLSGTNVTTSTIAVNTIFSNVVTYSTLSGSTINTSLINTSSLTCSTITTSLLTSSTLQANTLGVGSAFLATNGSNTGTTSSVPQYQLDVAGTARTSVFQYNDASVSVSEQNILDYTTFAQKWSQNIATSGAWTSIALSASGQYQVACINGGALWYSSNYGQTWTASATVGTTTLAWSAVASSGSGQYMSACVSTGNIWYSVNYGLTWTSAASSLVWSAIAISTSGQYQVACVTSGALWYSSNYGQTWTASTTSGTTALAWTAITISASGQYIYACVNTGNIWYSTNYGQTWTSTATSLAWTSIATCSTGKYVVACVTAGYIWYSINYGQTWTSVGTINTWGRVIISSSGQYQLASTTIPSLLYNYRFNVNDVQGGNVLNYATGQYDAALMNSAIITTASYKTGSASLSLTASNSQYVNLPSFTMTASITALTFACWINLNSSVGTWARVFDISRGLKGTTFPGTSYSFLCGYTPGVLNFYAGTETNASQSSLGHYTTPYTPSTGTWTHVAWVLGGSSWTIYINGAAVTPTVGTAVTQYLPPTGAYPYFFIGRSSWIADVYGYGNYNDFRMYSTALTGAQVSAIYNSGNGIIGSQIASTNFGATWTSTTGAQGNWQGLAMSSSGQYIGACLSRGIFTAVTSNNIATSDNLHITENVNTAMITYNDASITQSSSTLDYGTFGQNWTTTSNTTYSAPVVAVSPTGQYQAVATAFPATQVSPLTVMSGLQLWFDASDPNGTGVIPTAQTTISTWVDKSGNGRNAAVTGTFTVIPNTINSLPVVSMTNPVNSATSYGTVSVNGATVFPTYFNVISVYRVVSNVTYPAPWTYTRGDLMGYPIDQYGTTRYINSGANTSSYNISAANGTVLVSQLFNSNYAEYLNGSTSASLTAGPPNSQATAFKIGTRADNFTTFYGYMCEIIAYNTYMSTTNQQVLEGYLAWKWGIQGNLPAGHPYKNTSPANSATLGSPPFSMLSGLQLWLDASKLTIANGAVVSSWPTIAGTSYTFTSSTATYVTNAQNGLGVVSFPSGQAGGTVANFVLPPTHTIFMLTFAVGQTNSNLFLEHSAVVNNNLGFLLWSGNVANYGLNTGGGLFYVNGANVTVANTWQLLEGMNPDPANSNQMAFYLNGALSATGSAMPGTTPVTDTLNFNVRVQNACYLAEIIIYNYALTSVQRQQVEGYLAWKWGLQSILPANHLYRYTYPSTISTSSNYGQSWTISHLSSYLWSSIAISGQYMTACANAGNIWYSSTYGQLWTSTASSFSWSAIALSVSGQYQSACINGGAIWYSTNYGATWTASNSGSYAWTGIALSASGQYQYACHSTSSGGVFISTNYGLTWTLLPSTTFGTISAICCSASGIYVTIGSSTGIFYSNNYGQIWAYAVNTLGPTWKSLKCSASGQYQICTDYAASGSTYYSTNYGATWTAASNTTYQCGNVSLSQNGQYMLLASATSLYQSVTRIGAVSLQNVTYPTISYNSSSPMFVVLPGGIILQSGTVTINQVPNTMTSQAVSFPKVFPNNVCSVITTLSDNGVGYSYTNIGVMPQSITTSGFTCVSKYVAGSSQSTTTITVYWQAVGY